MAQPDTFKPFADADSVRGIGALTFENGPDRIGVHGSLDITRDAAGLAQARRLKATLDAIVFALEATDLPRVVAEAPSPAPRSVKNPFV